MIRTANRRGQLADAGHGGQPAPYWTTWVENSVPSAGTIGEANLDGTNVNNNLISSPNSPVGVAVSTEAPASKDGAKCRVPSVKGKKLAAAKKAIARAHCSIGRVKTVRSNHAKKGVVISQSRSAGRSLQAGSKVNVVVGRR